MRALTSRRCARGPQGHAQLRSTLRTHACAALGGGKNRRKKKQKTKKKWRHHPDGPRLPKRQHSMRRLCYQIYKFLLLRITASLRGQLCAQV